MNELAIRILQPEEGRFLRRIEWNAQEFESWMQELSTKYTDAAIITPDDLKASKADRTELNKIKKAISDRRIEVKKAVMEPYETFERELTAATEAIERVSASIDKSIKDYEASEKKAKRDRIKQMFDKEVKNPFYAKIDPKEMGFLEFDRVFDPKWLNASAKMAKVEKELNEKLAKIEEDLSTILTMDTDPAFRAGALQEYKRSLDLGEALKAHADMQARAQREQEARRREEEERLRREAEAAERKRREDMAALRERLAAEQQAAAPAPQDDRAGASVSGFKIQGQGNPQAYSQNATQGQRDGKFGPSGAAYNGAGYNNPQYSPYEGAPETGGVVPMGGALRSNQPAQPPRPQQEKTFFVEFRVEGTKDQLMALREYMNNNGLRYGPVKK